MQPAAPVEKFFDYIFKPGATHGKDHVFRSLGYSRGDAELLADLYVTQASLKYAAQDYTLGRADGYGQRINVTIELTGIGNLSGSSSYIISGWMIRSDVGLTLNTPFSGFARQGT